jgi:SPP1 gp7 family putative phage head morphogenesis protein
MAQITQKTSGTKDPVVIQQINVGQLNRGNKTIQGWLTAVKAAERVLEPSRRSLLDYYLDIDIDAHLTSVVQKRIRAVKTTPFEWEALENDKVMENFRSPWFFEMLGYVMSSVFKGHTLIECYTGQDGLIADVEMIPRQNVMPSKAVITIEPNINNHSDIHYREEPFSSYILEVGRANELGLYARLAPYVLLKRDNLADFSRFNEMFGMPLRVYEYDPHMPGARDEAVQSAEAQGAAAYIVLPRGTSVTFEEANQQGGSATYKEFHNIVNEEITIGVLGQLLTTGGSDGGSYALGGVHKAVEEGINLEDRMMVEYILNYPFKRNILIPHGYPLEGVTGSFQLTEELPMAKKAELWLKMEDRMPIAKEDFYNEFGTPHPDEAAIADWRERKEFLKPGLQPGGAGNERGKPLSLRSRIKSLYQVKHSCDPYAEHREIKLSLNTDELQRIIDELIERIYNGDVMLGDVDMKLYSLTAEELTRAIEAGTGLKLAEAAGADAALLKNLRDNVYVFSGFKNYQMLREATDLLFTPDGAKRSFSNFKAEILKLNNDYNVNFLRAEYQHAVGSSRMAAKWQKYEQSREALPLLQYITAGDQRVRQSHRPLDGITLPVTHEFWNEYYPPNDWGCRCSVRQVSDPDQQSKPDQYQDTPQLKEMFRTNTGKEQVIFPRNHPYYDMAPEHRARSQNNFGLPKPGDD